MGWLARRYYNHTFGYGLYGKSVFAVSNPEANGCVRRNKIIFIIKNTFPEMSIMSTLSFLLIKLNIANV
jgi:hypothetical protein